MQTENFDVGYQDKADERFARLATNVESPLSSAISKAPWRPKVARRITFFFGPIAGAFVVAISLRRMQHPQRARNAMLLGLVLTVVEAVVLFFVPDAFSRLVGFAAEIAYMMIFFGFMQAQFDEWQAAHASVMPANGWKAIGWGLLGAVLFFVIAILVIACLSAFLPGHV